MRLLNVLLLLILLPAFQSCKKKSLADCFKNTGKITEQWRETGNIAKIIVRDNIDIMLIPSDSSGVLISAGENLIDKIHTDIDADTIDLSNTNSCNWVRDFSIPVTAKIYINNICELDYRSIGDVNCSDTIFSDSLKINVYEGAGTLNVLVNSPFVVSAIHYGTADIKMSGRCKLSQVYSASFGLIDNRDFICQQIYVTNKSSNDIYVYAQKSLSASIRGIGNIYYKGSPDISLDNPGSGKLIELNE
jgi:hypothetical protein